MSRYKLRANYDIENIDSQKMDGTVIVDVPMLSNGELNYGLSHIKKKLYEENVYPSEIGFDIMSLATMVYIKRLGMMEQCIPKRLFMKCRIKMQKEWEFNCALSSMQ